MLTVGVAAGAPRARAGQTVAITIDGWAGSRTAGRRGGCTHEARAGGLRRRRSTTRREHSGRACGWPTAACWPKTRWSGCRRSRSAPIIALGLNYADHAKELSKELTVTAKDEPLAFLKGPGALIGHRGQTRRPADVTFMHYECELAVVIGAHARSNVQRADAMRYVAGYTVANDYAIRDYLENWYRPNLRVKNRDGCTVLGPWLVDAADVPDPHTWRCARWSTAQLTQQGNTRDMIARHPGADRIPERLHDAGAGDVILTGTPEGVVNVNVGDEVVTEIDGIGRLVNTIVGDAAFGR